MFLRFRAEYVHGIEDIETLKHIASKYTPFLVLDGASYESSLNLFRKITTINYLSGYLIEKSLSVDNLFLRLAILNAFSVQKAEYKRVLFWGIIGAIVLRCIFIFAGAMLIYRFEWVLYIFGAYLIYTGIKIYLQRNRDIKIEPQHHPVVKLLSRYFRVFPRYVKDHFFISKKGIMYVTPLFIVLMIIEFTDLIFAMDSIPAIFAVTRDPYIVFFSNIFAILGLRSMFFLLVNIVEKFYLLKIGVSVLLVFVGCKLLLHEWLVHIGFKPWYSLVIISTVLAGSILLSIAFPRTELLQQGISSR
jgi:tellurite resistance protein TerC